MHCIYSCCSLLCCDAEDRICQRRKECRQVQSVFSTVGGAQHQQHCSWRGSHDEHVSSMFLGSLGKLLNWMLPPHITLAAILSQAEPEQILSMVRIQHVGSIETGDPSDRDSNSGREKFLMSRERPETQCFCWKSPPFECRPAKPHSLKTDAVGASKTCCYPVSCNIL